MSDKTGKTPAVLAFLNAVEAAEEALGDMSLREATMVFKELELSTSSYLFRYHCQRILDENK